MLMCHVGISDYMYAEATPWNSLIAGAHHSRSTVFGPCEHGQGRRAFARSLSDGGSLSAPAADCGCGVVAVDAERSCRGGGSLSPVVGRDGEVVEREADGLVPSTGRFVARSALPSSESCSSGVPCPCSWLWSW